MIPQSEQVFADAMTCLIGAEVPRDVPRARALFQQAAAAGHIDAALFEAALAANGSGGPADWAAALARLRGMAPLSGAAQSQLALLERMNLAADGFPVLAPPGEVIGLEPEVRLFRGLLMREECAHVATSVQDIMEPSTVIDPRTGRAIANPIRTSAGAVIGPTREDLVIGAINRRLARISGTSLDRGESLSVLHYGAGQQYRPHVDALPAEPNQRIITIIIYLNDGYRGGETAFPHSGLQVSGRAGDAIMFRNVTDGGRMDQRALHAGLPVTAGRKWVATRWIREKPFDPWNAGSRK
jgi:prolyl 4-hydroxylase